MPYTGLQPLCCTRCSPTGSNLNLNNFEPNDWSHPSKSLQDSQLLFLLTCQTMFTGVSIKLLLVPTSGILCVYIIHLIIIDKSVFTCIFTVRTIYHQIIPPPRASPAGVEGWRASKRMGNGGVPFISYSRSGEALSKG